MAIVTGGQGGLSLPTNGWGEGEGAVAPPTTILPYSEAKLSLLEKLTNKIASSLSKKATKEELEKTVLFFLGNLLSSIEILEDRIGFLSTTQTLNEIAFTLASKKATKVELKNTVENIENKLVSLEERIKQLEHQARLKKKEKCIV